MRPLSQQEFYDWAFSQGVKSVTELVSVITSDDTVAITSVAEWRSGAAITTPGFARPPYRVETVPLGAYVANKEGFNCLSFLSAPGAKFTSPEEATAICERLNKCTKT